MEGFTLEFTVNKKILKAVSCSFFLMLNLNQGTDILFKKLKLTTTTKQ